MARLVLQQPATRPAVPIDEAALFRARIDEFLSTARIKAGFNGADLVARGGTRRDIAGGAISRPVSSV